MHKKMDDREARSLGFEDSLDMVETLIRWGWSLRRIAALSGWSHTQMQRVLQRGGYGVRELQPGKIKLREMARTIARTGI